MGRGEQIAAVGKVPMVLFVMTWVRQPKCPLMVEQGIIELITRMGGLRGDG